MERKQSQSAWPVMKIVGKKVFYIFFMVTCLVVAVLAATNIVSKYALRSYTEDQIRQLHWDAVLYQMKDIWETEKLHAGVAEQAGVTRVERMGTVRLALGTQLGVTIGGRPLRLPWFVILSPNDPSRLPPELRSSPGEITIALLSPQTIIRQQIGEEPDRSLRIDYTEAKTQKQTRIFETSFTRITQPERLELVKWFLDEFGSATFIPDQSVIVVLPKAEFDQKLPQLFTLIHQLSKPEPIVGNPDEGKGQTEPEGETLAASLNVEIMHLVAMDRESLFTGWDLNGSRNRISAIAQKISSRAKEISYESFLNSDLLVTLEKMSQVSRLIGLLTILISIPILWMAWHFAANLSRLVILNQRRLVGLLRLRGTSFGPIRKSLLAAIGGGGILGGVAGAVAGTFLPYVLYRMYGVEIPLALLFSTIQDPLFLSTFIVMGTVFSILSGKKIIDYMAQITPLEASRRVASSETSLRFEFTIVHMFAFFLGGAKMVAWSIGFTPRTESLQTVDMFFNFVAVPLFVYGAAAFIVSRSKVLHVILDRLAYPVTGGLRWFAVTDMLSRPQRVMSGILVAALAFAVVVYPRITADSFYDKALRGLRLNLGSDIAVRFDATTLTEGELKSEPLAWFTKNIGEKVQEIEKQIATVPGVRGVHALYEFSIPGSFYIPGKNYLQLYLLEDPERFLRTVYYENQLGVDKPFDHLVAALQHDQVIISRGFAAGRDSSNGTVQTLGLGRSIHGNNVESPVAGVTYLLPGTPQMMVADRESYAAAAVEFLNTITEVNPYVVGRLEDNNLKDLNVFLAGVVVAVDVGGPSGEVVEEITRLNRTSLIPEIAAISTEESESGKLSNDMFVRLGLENMKVFMFGGIFVAVSGIIAIAWVNFLERRRTFGMLRVRGASPFKLIRVVLAQMMIPVVIGGAVGVVAGLAAGYGLTNAIFTLPKVVSILGILDVHLTVTWFIALVVLVVLLIFLGTTLLLSSWIFRKSAREALRDV